jgi:hypothetical protein
MNEEALDSTLRKTVFWDRLRACLKTDWGTSEYPHIHLSVCPHWTIQFVDKMKRLIILSKNNRHYTQRPTYFYALVTIFASAFTVASVNKLPIAPTVATVTISFGYILHCVCFNLYCGGFILFFDMCVCVCVYVRVCVFGNMYTVLWGFS